MNREIKDIEVEVVEIDGVETVSTKPLDEEILPSHGWQARRQWSGRIGHLNTRWWPLWVILGIVALALFLTAGVAIGAIFLIVGVLVKLLRAILR